MNEEHCPNCRSKRSAKQETCECCGWTPLRSTEMLFVEGDQVACPSCSALRPFAAKTCPSCGAEQLLESLSGNTRNFQISSLLLLTTLVGICLALCRLTPAIGVPAFIVSGFAVLRSALLIEERKKHRYPTAAKDMLRLFAGSVAGIVAASVAFVVSWAVGAIFFGGIGEAVVGSPTVAIVLLTIFLGTSHLVTGIFAWRHDASRRMFVIALAFAGLTGGLVVLLHAVGLEVVAHWSGLLPLSIACVGPIIVACRRGGAERAKGFLIGFSSAISLLGLVVVSLYGINPRAEVGLVFLASGCHLLPLLLAVVTMQGIWKWDDAFPRAISHLRPAETPLRSPTTATAPATAEEMMIIESEDNGEPESV